MKNFALILTMTSLLVLGCGSSEPQPTEPVATNAPATSPETTVPTVDPALQSGAPTGAALPENSGGTAIKANELGPQ